MPDARLTHPLRGTLEFRQRQSDEFARESVQSIVPEIGTDREPLVHTRTRQAQRQITGRVSGLRRADNDPGTADAEQALANYIAELEAHVDEFQGTGYTFEDDLRNLSKRAIYRNVTWRYMSREPYDIDFDITLHFGRGTFDERPIDLETPTVDDSMSVPARVGGHDLPGLREMQVQRGFEVEVNAVYAKGDAENNDVVAQEGVVHRIIYRGIHSGTEAERRQADANLAALEGGGQVTFETRFPGYDLEGFVNNYTTTEEARFGGNSHHYSIEFIEGTPA